MWLNSRDLDIRCIRIKPYKLDQKILLDVHQVIPLPEAAEEDGATTNNIIDNSILLFLHGVGQPEIAQT